MTIWIILISLTLADDPPVLSKTPHRLHLRTGSHDTAALADVRQTRDSADLNRRYVLQLDGPMTPARRAALTRLGVYLGPYFPEHAYMVRLSAAVLKSLDDLDFISWVGEYQTSWKLDPAIGRRVLASRERQALRAAGRFDGIIHLFNDAETDAVLGSLRRLGVEVHGVQRIGPRDIVHAEASVATLAALAEIDAIQFIEESPELAQRNDTNEWIVQSNVDGETPIWDQGLHGEGQIGGIIDWPFNVEHCVFADVSSVGPDHRKIVAYRSSTGMGADSHGTHVCGTYAGDSGASGEHDFRDGIAFAARVSYSSAPDINLNPETLYQRLLDAQDDGAFVHSNSWGDDGTTDYTTWSEQADRFSYENEDSLVVFAVTNQSLLRTPENAKNVLAVGASSDTPNQSDHCMGGAGPTADGRRKPEIFAPGCTTFSARAASECDFVSFNGTSYATPVVAGSALLARQYFVEGYFPTGSANEDDGFTPSGALLKATLLNSAQDMTGEASYPSDQEGWGRLLLDQALFFDGDDHGLFVSDVRNEAGLETGDSLAFDVTVANADVPLRITLVWTDPPATVGAAFVPVNDLNMIVTGPDDSVYLGNGFMEGESAEEGVADSVNNVEQVHRLQPRAGSYSVVIEAEAVNEGPQGFALVITGNLGEDEPPVVPGCSGDVNGDTIVDGLDAFSILNGFCAEAPCDDLLDANADGVVNPLDFGYVLARLGVCP